MDGLLAFWTNQCKHLVPDLVLDICVVLRQVKSKNVSWKVAVQILVPTLWPGMLLSLGLTVCDLESRLHILLCLQLKLTISG